MGRRKPSTEWAQDMLAHITAECDRETWFEIACALHSGLGTDGWPVFLEWSRTAPQRFNHTDAQKLWSSLTGERDWVGDPGQTRTGVPVGGSEVDAAPHLHDPLADP